MLPFKLALALVEDVSGVVSIADKKANVRLTLDPQDEGSRLSGCTSTCF